MRKYNQIRRLHNVRDLGTNLLFYNNYNYVWTLTVVIAVDFISDAITTIITIAELIFIALFIIWRTLHYILFHVIEFHIHVNFISYYVISIVRARSYNLALQLLALG